MECGYTNPDETAQLLLETYVDWAHGASPRHTKVRVRFGATIFVCSRTTTVRRTTPRHLLKFRTTTTRALVLVA